ncbi:ABC transporter substrate-binding protein [Limobrevibacterium gyesilva]|uniref:ABC transporter substrate-binding protein n=1 Tax=Limobrevibacterium gyesilva TaxID=2991712 RepID=A0AA41YXH8_9PROT|nr:ABC transporter substrate-binding protein [Limobrevibacterium gyesilva]MCW3477132.1 ABC transporter substrate-binding protein [Limobrevibacterium gyesilva]
MQTTRRSLLLGTGLAATATFAARAQANTLALGALYPFSGGLALLGDESYRGLELAADERNAAGGLLGKPIRLVKGDAVDQNQAISEARRLMSAERVPAIFGTYSSALAFAATQVTELAGVPYFELGAISDPITERGFKYLFRSCAVASNFAVVSVDTIGDALAPLWKVEAKSLKIAILHEDALYGSTVAGFQEKRCKEQGLNVVEKMAYAASTTDLSSTIQRLRGADVDVVLHTGFSNDIVLLYRGMKQAGWKPRMIIGSGAGYSLNDTMQAVGADFEGTMNVDFTQYKVNEKMAPGAAAVAVAYQKKYGAPPRSGHSLANYMGGKLFLDVIARAGSTDKDKVRAAVLATDIPIGHTATGWGAKFDDKGQNTRAQPFLLQWQKGMQVTVFPADAAVAEPLGVLGS